MSLFDAPHPFVPVAKFNVADGLSAVLEQGGQAPGAGELALLGERRLQQQDMPTYSLFPPQPPAVESEDSLAPDFLGRLHHMKTLFRMPASKEPVSVMVHRVGPLLILDDGPIGWSRSGGAATDQPLPNLPGKDGQREHSEAASSLMLAPLDPTLETALVGAAREAPEGSPQSRAGGLALPELRPSELRHLDQMIIKNTFVDIVEDEAEEYEAPMRTQSAPAGTVAAGAMPQGSYEPLQNCISPAMQKLQEHAERAASLWSLIPYEGNERRESAAALVPTSAGTGDPSLLPAHLAACSLSCQPQSSKMSWDLLNALEAVRGLYADLPPQPSRFGRAVEWRCGPYRVLLGCDLVVLHSGEACDASNYASFKMLPPGSPSEPSREDKIDVYLENMMCDITKAVWGSHQQGQTTWRVFNTKDLPSQEPGQQDILREQGQRLLHFLRQQCHKEGGTYWLYREANASNVELFDLSTSTEPGADQASCAFAATPSLAAPLATVCFHLAKGMESSSDQRQLLQKALHLLEPHREEHPALYSESALQLAYSYMRTPTPALPDAPGAAAAAPPAQQPAAARLAVALRFLEGVLRLLMSADGEETEAAMLAELRLRTQVTYAECILKLVREACVPTYSAWLTEVKQRAAEESVGQATGPSLPETIGQMKQLSAAFLLWRLFWLCRANRALAFVPAEKRETECWILDRDLCEHFGDTLYGLSRYPADDVDDLLGGSMATAEGICRLVEETLRAWGLTGGGAEAEASPRRATRSKAGKKKRLTSPLPSPDRARADGKQPHNVNAMFLSKLNPLARNVGDEALVDDPLVRDDLRRALWVQGKAFRRSLDFYERATTRLRRSSRDEEEATNKIARKLAHLYNEEARANLVHSGGSADTQEAERLLTKAHSWMIFSGDHSNASRVQLNLSELHARRAEELMGAGGNGEPAPFSDAQYQIWLRAIGCCEEAARLSDNSLGRREGAFAHLRLGVHLSVRIPRQLHGEPRRPETLAELADRHFGKALRGFDELREEREVAVCHFHMADLALQEQMVPGAPPLPKGRLVAALRHAKRSAEYWERAGALQYAKDFIAANIRAARLLECCQRAGAIVEALEHLGDSERRLLELAQASPVEAAANEALFTAAEGQLVAVPSLRREMGRACQSGLRHGEDVDRLKTLYRRILRNEPLSAA